MVARLLLVGLLTTLSAAAAVAAFPDWLERWVTAADASGGTLDAAVARIKRLADDRSQAPLAVEGTQEGHVRLVNRAGEVATAADAKELERVLGILLPAAGKPGPTKAQLAFYLTEATLFRHRATVAGLPREATLHLVIGHESLRLLRHGRGASEQLLVEVRPGMVVAAGERARLDEARWQLGRPLSDLRPRLMALEPGGLASIPVRPRIDRSTRRAVVDIVDPDRLAGAVSALREQTALIIGRSEGDRLVIQPRRGSERSLLVKDVVGAASDGDANLVVLQSSAPRQPSGRNWLWLKVEVPGLDTATEKPTLGDMLSALVGRGRAIAVTAERVTADRVRITAHRLGDLGAAPSRLGSFLDEMGTSITGNVGIDAVEGWLTSRSRAAELAWRLVPGVPSILQVGWLVLTAIGLAASPVARRWWVKVWPPEERAEYAVARGYVAAKVLRAAAFLLLFLPAVAVPAAIAGLCNRLLPAVSRS